MSWKLWLKANHDSHVAKHQERKLKKLLKKKRICWETTRAQYMCMLAKVDALSFWKKVLAKGTRCRQDQCSYTFGRFPRASWPIFATHTALN
jgi:hypothetical protein